MDNHTSMQIFVLFGENDHECLLLNNITQTLLSCWPYNHRQVHIHVAYTFLTLHKNNIFLGQPSSLSHMQTTNIVTAGHVLESSYFNYDPK
jgi:hypothetical protein